MSDRPSVTKSGASAEPSRERGADYFDRRHAERAARRHVRQLETLGFRVTIEKAA
jgi:hypothetical protein